MRVLLRSFLKEECDKLVTRHFEYLFQLREATNRAGNRLGTLPAKRVQVPNYWAIDPRFNPFKVRKDKALDWYSEVLDRRLKKRSYEPRPAVVHTIKKEDGTDRILNVYQLPDAAVSRLVYKSLLHKNLNRFSAYAYAYREDRGSHDAVQAIYSEWKRLDRVYVAEFDFSKFFDNILHKYLWRVLDQHGFICSPAERCVLEAFLRSTTAPATTYKAGPFAMREKGIPQGTSVSLFLANLACWELDMSLERLGVGFARYADDTVVWSESYAKVIGAYDLIKKYSDLMEVPINLDKSQGINVVARRGRAEISFKPSIDFLGYKISPASVAIKEGRVKKIKAKISFIVYQNLLQPLKKGIFNSARLAGIDWDYLVAISQIRRYLYGGLNDEKLRMYIRGQIPHIRFMGLMSFYPLVNDKEQLALLDGWLIYLLKQCLKKREAMWVGTKGTSLPGPTPDWIENLTDFKTWTSPTGHTYDFKIPSFSLINRALVAAMERSGISAATHPKSAYYAS